MLNGYGAPLQIYQHLEYHEDSGPGKIPQIYTPFTMIYFLFVYVHKHISLEMPEKVLCCVAASIYLFVVKVLIQRQRQS